MSNLLRTVSFASTGIALFAAAPAVAAPTWSAPTTVATASSAVKPALEASLKVESDAAGNQVAAWAGNDVQGQRGIYAASRPAGGAWSAPTVVEAFTTYGSGYDFSLDVSANGYVALAWIARGSGDPVARSRFVTRTPQGVWSAGADLEPFLSSQRGGTQSVAVSITPQGDLWGSWLRIPDGTDNAPAKWDRQLVRRAAGATTFTTEPLLTENRATVPQFYAAGNGLAVYTDGWGVKSRYRPAGGPWQAAQEVVQPKVDQPDGQTEWAVADLRVAYGPAGTAVASWSRVVGPNVVVEVSRRSADGQWSAPKTVASFENNFGATGAASVGGLGLDDAGNATVALTKRTIVADEDAQQAVHTVEVLTTTSGPGSTSWSPLSTALAPVTATHVYGNLVPSPYDDLRLTVGNGGHALLTWKGSAGNQVSERLPGSTSWAAPSALPQGGEAKVLGVTVDGKGVANALWTNPADDRLVASSGVIGATTPPPATKQVVIKATLGSWSNRCPRTIQATLLGGRTVNLPVQAQVLRVQVNCATTGAIPVPASAKLGSTQYVVLTGAGVFPAFVATKVVAG